MISLLIPTRNRPKMLEQVIVSARDTATQPDDLEFCLYLDDDDNSDYAAILQRQDVRYKVGPRITLSQMWNECFAISTGDILMQGNDDILFKTGKWDDAVRTAFAAEPIQMVHGSDGQERGHLFGCHPFVHRQWVEAVGYFTPPYFSSDYGDSWLNDLANLIGRRTYVPVLIEHLHYIFGKVPIDRTTEERLARHNRDNVYELYQALGPMRNHDAAKLRRRISGMTDTSGKQWSILILTQPSRAGFLQRLLDCIQPQVDRFPDVELRIRMFNPSMDLGANRSAMIEEAPGRYVNFIDDDDLVPGNYVERIYPLLDKDYVGFRLQMDIDGNMQKPTYHSLKYTEWNGDGDGWYRDISHLNPIRRELAVQVPMNGGHGEDARWAAGLRRLGIVKTENYIPEIMYFYHFRNNKERYEPPPVQTSNPNDLFIVGHRGPACPKCGNTATGIAGGMRICNQCGANWT